MRTLGEQRIMANPHADDRYRSRRADRRIVIISADGTRSFTVRPWIAATLAAAGAALSVAFLGATTYLIFRDDLINMALARNATLQEAYEDRIASLRSEIDKIASRQILEQVAFDDKVERLMAVQAAIGNRQKIVSELIDRARRTGLLEGRSGDDHAAADPMPTGSTDLPASGYADATSTAAAIEQRFAALTEPAPNPAGAVPPAPESTVVVDADGRPDLRAIADRLARIDRQQAQAVVAIVAAADARADKVKQIVSRLGVTVALPEQQRASGDADAMGGPYVPLDSPEALGAALAEADAAFGRLDTLRKVVGKLPVAPPLPGAVMTSNFGSRSDPFLGSAAFHAGVDFRSPTGTDVHATAPGRIVTAGRNGGYGNMVEIDHGKGLTTRYAHLSKIAVEVGQTVARGTVVGEVGSTGRSTGPHLHYETRVNGTAVNPTAYMKAGREIATILN